MAYKYATQTTEKNARAVGIDLPISTKVSREICKFIRGKTTTRAKKILQDAMDKEKAIPYRRYNDNVGHRPGLGPARFPDKASMHIKKIVELAEANARFKGMNAENLEIQSILAQKGSITHRYGRHSRRKAKRTHIEIVLKEAKKEPKKEYKRKEVTKQ